MGYAPLEAMPAAVNCKLRNQIQQPLLPTILFLQGAGEQGSNLDDVKKHAVAKIVE